MMINAAKLPTAGNVQFGAAKKLRIMLTGLQQEPLKSIHAYMKTEFNKLGISQYGMPGLNASFVQDKKSTKPPEFDVMQFSHTITPDEFKTAALKITGFQAKGKGVSFTWQGKTYGVEYEQFNGKLTC